MITSKENTIGAWTFLIGVILAALIGIFSALFPVSFIVKYSAQVYAILFLIGLFVGYMNVVGRDSQTFLLAGAVLVIVSRFGMESVAGSLIGIGAHDLVTSVFGALLALFVPATIVVALKTVFSIAKV